MRRAILFGLGITLAAASLVNAQPNASALPASEASKATDTAAATGLRSFVELVNDRNFRRMGFESPDEVKTAVLGEPLRDAFIRLDQLRAFTAGSEVTKLLTPGQRVVYPVAVGAAVRSSISVARQRDGWKAVSFGAPNLTRALASARESAARQAKVPPSELFVVRVPALKVQFLAYSNAGVLSFVAIVDDARLGLKKGQTLPATDVIERLAKVAQDVREDAPG